MLIPKYVARDGELSTTSKAKGERIDSWRVTQDVLDQVGAAVAARGGTSWSSPTYLGSRYSSDCLRRWTGAGQCYYSDMSHVEVCTAEVLSPRAFASQSISTLLLVEDARRLAEQESSGAARFALAASNADMLDPDISWGTHLNVSISEDLWEDLFLDNRHPARLGFVASAMAAAIPFFGAGYILPRAGYQAIYNLSARAHHLTKVHSLATTEAYRRGLLNSRRESHGHNDRLHLIGFDYCIVAAALKASFVQCLLAAAEEGFCGELLYSPVDAMRAWSGGLDLATGTLPATATTINGDERTLPDYVCRLTRQLLEMCEAGLITEQVAPEAQQLLPTIIDLTHYVAEGSIHLAARHLDWAAKLMYLLARGESFDAPGSRLADHDFSNTDRARGFLWQLIADQQVDPLVSIESAEACITNPPTDSRAWGRGELISRFRNQITAVNWDRVELLEDNSYWSPRVIVDLADLAGMTAESFGPLLRQADTVADLRRLLQQRECEPASTSLIPLPPKQ